MASRIDAFETVQNAFEVQQNLIRLLEQVDLRSSKQRQQMREALMEFDRLLAEIQRHKIDVNSYVGGAAEDESITPHDTLLQIRNEVAARIGEKRKAA